jgi:hypothetical protein
MATFIKKTSQKLIGVRVTIIINSYNVIIISYNMAGVQSFVY